MKRIEALANLSREHHESLKLAKQCLDTLASGDKARIEALCRDVANNFDTSWDRHFHNEEATIFSITTTLEGKIHELGEQLVKEHDRMRDMAKSMKAGDCSRLREFGELLRSHTRVEERELFPLVETHFSPEQLAIIAQQTVAN